MKIFTGEYKAAKIIGLYLKKKRNTFVYLKEKEFDIERFKEKNSYVALDIPDFSIQKVETPPIKDKSAVEFILKNKLSAQLEEDINNYHFTYVKDEAQSTSTNYVFNVFLIKKSYIYQLFSENVLENLNLLTLSAFSLAGITKLLNKSEYIIHFYGDEKRSIIVLCKDGQVEYARETTAPEFIFSEEDLRNFYYESLNLTYIYLRQNRNINIGSILVSGNILEDFTLINDIYNFTGLPIFCLNPKQIIKNIDTKVFNKHTIAIGNLFLEKTYDIREKEILYKKTFNVASKYVALSLLVLLLVLFAFFIKNFVSYKTLQAQLSKEKQYFKQKVQIITKDIKITPKELNYYITYVKLYDKAFNYTLFNFLEDIKPLLSLHKFNNLSFKKLSDNKFSITLQSTVSFNSLLSLNKFEKELNKKLSSIKKKIEVRNNSKIDINKLIINLDITLIKHISRQK